MGAYWSYPYYGYGYGHRRPYAYHYYPHHYAPSYPLWYYVGQEDAHHIQNPGNFLTSGNSNHDVQTLMQRFITDVYKYQNTKRLKKIPSRCSLSKMRSDIIYSAELLGKALGHNDSSMAVMASHAMLMIDYTDKKTGGGDAESERYKLFGQDLDRVTTLVGEGYGIHGNAWIEYLNCSTRGLTQSRKQRIINQRKVTRSCVNLVDTNNDDNVYFH